MSEQRDELAEVIGFFGHGGIKLSAYRSSGRVSVEVLADNAVMDFSELIGFVDQIRKPRTITTVEEVDALAVGSVVHSSGHVVWEKLAGAEKWARSGQDFLGYARAIALPATVLYEPTP